LLELKKDTDENHLYPFVFAPLAQVYKPVPTTKLCIGTESEFRASKRKWNSEV
jgi:hypothetical protein